LGICYSYGAWIKRPCSKSPFGLYYLAMDSASEKQLFEAISKAQRVLIALPASPNGDTLGSSLAFSSFLKKLNKEVEIYSENKNVGNFSFLPGVDQIKPEINLPKNFVISVSTEKTKVDEISYHSVGNSVNIYLKPKEGSFTSEDISFGNGSAGFDLIVTIDTPSLEHLGGLYAKNAEIFFETPKVNIDNHINNENYGNINIVDITAASTAEVIFELIKKYETSLIDKEMATSLLAGIIAETNSFQKAHTTPNSFLKASELISFGANQQEIIQYLFKTKDFSVLKLWGRAMARINHLPEYGTVFSVVGISDLEKSEAGDPEINQVFQELANNITDARLLFFVAERPDHLDMYIHAHPNVQLEAVVNYFGGKIIAPNSGKVQIANKQITEVEDLLKEALPKLRTSLGL
jgi:bifunctional oligoribonuclease and PAP phosphatase NrnA